MIRIDVPSGVLAELIDSYVATHPERLGESAAARRHRALPVYGDFMGYWMLTLRGELAFVPDDAQGTIELVRGLPVERSAIHVAFAQAARRYPVLAPYCPQRIAADLTCTHCDGTGRIRGAPANIICQCGGLGWLPAAISTAV